MQLWHLPPRHQPPPRAWWRGWFLGREAWEQAQEQQAIAARAAALQSGPAWSGPHLRWLRP